MAAKDKGKGKGKDKAPKAKKGKKGDAPAPGGVRIAAHPKARAQIASARAWGGIAGFVIAFLLAMRAGITVDGALQRALLAGVTCWVAAWFLAVTVWRQILVGEVHRMRRELEARILAQAQATAGTGERAA